MSFGNRLKTALDYRNMSQKDFANLIGVTEVSVSRWISGSRYPNIQYVQIICSTLHLSADWLLEL